jgi:hypothetical protein
MASVDIEQLPKRKDEDDPTKDEEELFSFPERQPQSEPFGRLKLVLIVVTLVLVGAVVWLVVGRMIDPCQGLPAGTVVEDPDHSDSVIVCKG